MCIGIRFLREDPRATSLPNNTITYRHRSARILYRGKCRARRTAGPPLSCPYYPFYVKIHPSARAHIDSIDLFRCLSECNIYSNDRRRGAEGATEQSRIICACFAEGWRWRDRLYNVTRKEMVDQSYYYIPPMLLLP